MNTQTANTTIATCTAEDLITSLFTYPVTAVTTAEELPDDVWLATAALRFAELTGEDFEVVTEAVARNHVATLRLRSMGISPVKVGEFMVGFMAGRNQNAF